MENGKQPVFAQSENWQCDLEKHIQDPKKYGSPSFEGIGLTKREYFAGLAMQGLLSNSEFIKRGSFDFKSSGTKEKVSSIATNISDALLAELEKTKEE
jgi:hypothetical protein